MGGAVYSCRCGINQQADRNYNDKPDIAQSVLVREMIQINIVGKCILVQVAVADRAACVFTHWNGVGGMARLAALIVPPIALVPG
jgi:hypothetical protein